MVLATFLNVISNAQHSFQFYAKHYEGVNFNILFGLDSKVSWKTYGENYHDFNYKCYG